MIPSITMKVASPASMAVGVKRRPASPMKMKMNRKGGNSMKRARGSCRRFSPFSVTA